MEPNQTPAPQTNPTPPVRPSHAFKSPLPKKVYLISGIVCLLLAVVVMGMIFGSVVAPNEDKPKETAVKPTSGLEEIQKTAQTAENSPNAKAPSHLIVYGAWTGQSSVIKAVDVANGNVQLLATLPMEVKKVAVLDEQTLLYIDQIDKKDHGKQIALYNIKDKKITATIPASAGYGIDEYTLSPDKKYLAIWEVSFAQGSEVFQGGKSRVYAVNLANPSVKNLLYDETATKPVHYPRAILNNGTVFADTFMPNDPNGGAGWANGMSMVSFDGTNKKDLDMMKAGTYGTQPSLSQDGKYLLFAGYDGKYGDGNSIKSGLRRAILSPNTVDVLNTQTLQRFKLANLSNEDSYPTAHWDAVTGKVILSVVGQSAQRTGLYEYDLTGKSLEKITIPTIQNTEYMLVSHMSANSQLIGTFEENASNLGNLGANYEYAYSRMAAYDTTSGKSTPLTLEDSYAQYITVLPGGYFKDVLGAKTIAQAANPNPTIIDLYSDKNDAKQRLQLYTFFLKAELQPVRMKQQSTPISSGIPSTSPKLTMNITPQTGTFPPNDDNMPKCNDVTAKVCAEKGQGPGTKDYVMCKGMYKAQNMERTCDDSPLYLYGENGKKVHVTIQTPVHNAIPSYRNGYDITMLEDGIMQINGKNYQRISYDYESNLRRITPPKEGRVVARKDVENVLKEYALHLGLNEKETADLIKAGKQKVTTPYAFISFFDHETSHQILPITFSPKPDNYLNVVFYFKLLDEKPAFTPVPPSFTQPLKRSGFTAVEVSEMVE